MDIGGLGDRVRELIVTPESVESLPRDMARELLPRLGALQAQLTMRALAVDEPDQILDASQAGRLVGLSKNFMLDHWREWPFAFRVGRFVRFSRRGLLEWARAEGKR